MDVMYCVYSITHKASGRRYIGKGELDEATDTCPRWLDHWSRQTPLGRALRTHGEAAFKHEILMRTPHEPKTFVYERFWIRHFRTNMRLHGDEFGYNQTGGGEGRRASNVVDLHREVPMNLEEAGEYLLIKLGEMKHGFLFQDHHGAYEKEVLDCGIETVRELYEPHVRQMLWESGDLRDEDMVG